MKRTKTSTKSNSSKVNYTFKKNNVIFEDNSSPTSKFQIIFDKNKPLYEHTWSNGNGHIQF